MNLTQAEEYLEILEHWKTEGKRGLGKKIKAVKKDITRLKRKPIPVVKPERKKPPTIDYFDMWMDLKDRYPGKIITGDMLHDNWGDEDDEK